MENFIPSSRFMIMRRDDPEAFDALCEIHEYEGGDIRALALSYIRAYLELCYDLEPRGESDGHKPDDAPPVL